jgi:hypothetical protein
MPTERFRRSLAPPRTRNRHQLGRAGHGETCWTIASSRRNSVALESRRRTVFCCLRSRLGRDLTRRRNPVSRLATCHYPSPASQPPGALPETDSSFSDGVNPSAVRRWDERRAWRSLADPMPPSAYRPLYDEARRITTDGKPLRSRALARSVVRARRWVPLRRAAASRSTSRAVRRYRHEGGLPLAPRGAMAVMLRFQFRPVSRWASSGTYGGGA